MTLSIPLVVVSLPTVLFSIHALYVWLYTIHNTVLISFRTILLISFASHASGTSAVSCLSHLTSCPGHWCIIWLRWRMALRCPSWDTLMCHWWGPRSAVVISWKLLGYLNKVGCITANKIVVHCLSVCLSVCPSLSVCVCMCMFLGDYVGQCRHNIVSIVLYMVYTIVDLLWIYIHVYVYAYTYIIIVL